MSEWINVQTLVAFVLGVLLAAWVRTLVSGLKAKVGG